MRDVIADPLTAMRSERAKLDAAIRALETTTGAEMSSDGLPVRTKNGKKQYEIAPGRWVGRARCAQLGISVARAGGGWTAASKQRWAARKAQRVDDAIGNQAETRELVPA